jgi:6-hydroxycyclohex-1-ene-1-carbonyl-CoA dehydrogenase
MKTIDATGYYFTGSQPVLEKRTFTIDAIADDQAVVQIAGCGLCHTDLGFIAAGVRTKAALPLILGHEISGTVVAAGSKYTELVGRSVIVPAVLPCGTCELCVAGRDNICQSQKMPGNDFNGGFATHVVVPARFLCSLPKDLGDYKLSQLSVIADAVTTPYQSLIRSGLRKGDVAIVIGTGGIGLYMVQLAKNAGGRVVAIDIDANKLEHAKQQGAEHVICSAGLSEKDIKDQVRGFVSKNSLSKYQWKVFETSGSAGGQNLGFSLLSYAGVLGVVGFTMEKLSLRLSNVMAFDADVFGNLGCRPAHYPKVVEQVLGGSINVRENVREYPLDSINEVISLALAHKLEKRAILVP